MTYGFGPAPSSRLLNAVLFVHAVVQLTSIVSLVPIIAQPDGQVVAVQLLFDDLWPSAERLNNL